MSSLLHISEDLALPPDTVTSTVVVYGGKGMGKTNFGAVLVEELSAAGLRWCAIDPLGVWYGIRHSADGKRAGVECLILGGPHGDIPIEPTGGAVVADLVADERVDVVIDISRKPDGSMWSVGERTRFVTDYALQLFRRQGELAEGRRKEPIFQLLDEAARYIPQTMPANQPDIARCVGAWTQLVEEGRNIGIGVCLLTQRSARMSKSVSELADAMVAFRTIGPNSVAAVVDWLGEHVDKQQAKTMIERLRSLPVGAALLVSPGWLNFEAVIRVRPRRTYDSSATPKPGEQRAAPGKAARPDLAAYTARMAETIERARENDPRELRKRIAALEAQLRDQKPETVVETRTIPVFPPEQEAALRDLIHQVKDAAGEIVAFATNVCVALGQLPPDERRQPAPEPPGRTAAAARAEKLRQDPPPPAPQRPTPPPASSKSSTSSTITGPQQKVLDSLADFAALGVHTPTRENVAVFAGYSSQSGGYRNTLGGLRTAGLLDYPAGGLLQLTELGKSYARPSGNLRTLSDLHQAWYDKLPNPQASILLALIEEHPHSISREDLAGRLGYSATSGGFRNYLGALRSLGVIDYPAQGMVAATSLLFPEGLR